MMESMDEYVVEGSFADMVKPAPEEPVLEVSPPLHNYKNPYTTRPCDVEPMDAFAMKVVAVAGHADDWTAYYGPSNCTDERVASEGTKLFHTQAEPLFYVMIVRKYRS